MDVMSTYNKRATGESCTTRVLTVLERSVVHIQCHVYRLIEEFMLLANMAVAHKIWRAFPKRAMLRRHPMPKEKLAHFLVSVHHVHSLSLSLPPSPPPPPPLSLSHTPSFLPLFHSLTYITDSTVCQSWD